MLKLTKNDGTVRSFNNDSELCGYLMEIENEKLLGCDLYLMLQKDLPGDGLHTPTALKSEDGSYSLIVSTRDGVKRIADPMEIGIDTETLDTLFEEYLHERKAFLFWDSPILEAIRGKGGHNKFWGDNIKRPWSFLVFSPDRIARLINTLEKSYDLVMLHEAWEKQRFLVEVCKGDFKALECISIERGSEAEIVALQKEWCWNYCKMHGLALEETR
jgi:hypothetical protein